MKKNNRLFKIVFLAPALSLYLLFILISIIMSFGIGFTDWNVVGKMHFLGLDNYTQIVHDRNYWQVLKNTGLLVAASAFVQVPLAVVLAYMVFRSRFGMKLCRTVYFLPTVVAPIIIGVMFSLFYNGEVGIVNPLLMKLGIIHEKVAWLSNKDTVLGAVMVPQIWQFIGYYFVIMLAGLQGIPKEMFESSQIDGADTVQTFFYIALPLAKNACRICLVLGLTGALKAFVHPMVLTEGGPGVASSYVALYMLRTAFSESRFGYGSAITMTIMVYTLAITFFINRFVLKDRA